MESEKSPSQHDNARSFGLDSSLHGVQDQVNDQIDTLSQWLTIIGSKIGVAEQSLINFQTQINNINRRLDSIENRLEIIDEDVKARDAQLAGDNTHLLYIRAGELENIWDKVTDHVGPEDIYILHGADVALDIRALNFLVGTDQQRYEVAQVGFENLYGFTFNNENIQRITNAPLEIRKTIDKRANLKFLRAWKWSSETEYLVDKCDGILKRWENKLNWYYPNVQLRQEYEEMEELYINKGV